MHARREYARVIRNVRAVELRVNAYMESDVEREIHRLFDLYARIGVRSS